MAALSTIFAIASVALSVVSAKMQKDRAKKAAREAAARADAARGLEITVENTVLALAIPYGRCKVGGARTLVFVPGSAPGISAVTSTARTTFGIDFMSGLEAILGSLVGITPIDYSNSNSQGRNNRVFSNTNLRGDGRYISKNDRRKNFHQVLILQQAISVAGINQVIFPLVDGKRWDSVGQAPCVHINTFCDGDVVDPFVSQYGYTNNRFEGVAYASCGFYIEDGKYYDVQFSGVPDVQFIIEGLRVRYVEAYDNGNGVIVHGMTSWREYSNNPALCLLDYLTNTKYGLGVKEYEIDLKSFYTAMIACEYAVVIGAPRNGLFWWNNNAQRDIKRFECNIALSSEAPIRDNINKILESMDMAELVWSGGTYKLQLKYPTEWFNGHPYATDEIVQYVNEGDMNLYRSLISGNTAPLLVADPLSGQLVTNTAYWSNDAVSVYITDDNIIRGKDLTLSMPNAQTRYNRVTVRFRNEALDFVDDTVSWPPKGSTVLNTFLIEDNRIPLEMEIYEEAVTDSYHAAAKAEQRCRLSRMQDIVKITVTGDAAFLEPGDIAHLRSTPLGINGRLYIVSTAYVQPDNSVDITMGGIDARMLAWNAPDEAVISIVPYVDADITQATNVTFEDNQLAWTASTDARVSSYIIYYTTTPVSSVNMGTSWIEMGPALRSPKNLPGTLASGTYTFAVVAISASNVLAPQSGWPLVSGEVTSTPAAPEPTISYIDTIIYRRSVSIPESPTTGTYNFSSMSLSVVPTDWSVGIPAGVDPLWSVTGIAEYTPGATTFNMSGAWSTVLAVDEAALVIASLTPDAVIVMQDYSGVNFNYDGAVGVFQVFVEGVEKTQTNEVAYTVVSTNNCIVTIDNTVGVGKGVFTVTELVGNLGTAVLRATIGGDDYDRTLSVSALNEGYIVDISAPPEPVDWLVNTGFNHFTIELDILPSYSEGHGHGQTDVYYARVLRNATAPDFLDASPLGTFEGILSHQFVVDVYDTGTELTWHDYDYYIWISYITKDGTAGPESVSPAVNFNKIKTSAIAENAVTLPVSAESFSSLLPLELPSTDFGGADVLVTVNASGLLVNTAGESAAMEIRLDSTLIHTIPMLVGTQEIGAIPMASGSFTYFDGPGVGEHVYELTVTGLDSVLHQSITVVGLKR